MIKILLKKINDKKKKIKKKKKKIYIYIYKEKIYIKYNKIK